MIAIDNEIRGHNGDTGNLLKQYDEIEIKLKEARKAYQERLNTLRASKKKKEVEYAKEMSKRDSSEV